MDKTSTNQESINEEGVRKHQLIGLVQAMVANVPPARFSEAVVEATIVGLQTMLQAIPEEKHAEVLMDLWSALLPIVNRHIPDGL